MTFLSGNYILRSAQYPDCVVLKAKLLLCSKRGRSLLYGDVAKTLRRMKDYAHILRSNY
jgi:hypothetical protein